MVVARRVDQVPQDFARAPAARPGATRRPGLVHLLKQLEAFSDGGVQLRGRLGAGHDK
jgi:hypothetical protein